MRQIVNKADGGYEVLVVEEAPDPQPEGNELLIEVRAAGLNFADIMARKGLYRDAPEKPCVMGYEVAGIVSKAGPGADPAWKDKEVMALTRFKGQAGKVVVKESQVFEKPEELSFEEAAVIPVNYLTGWVLIRVMGALQSGESILIQNVGGGVGIASADIARHTGATVYGTASAHKHPFLKSRGVDYMIDYRNSDWYEELMELTEGKGVELIIDPLGGKEWKRGYKALCATGRLGMFGVSVTSGSGFRGKLSLLREVLNMPFYHPLSLMSQNKSVFGVNLANLWHEEEKARSWITGILNGVKEGWIKPHVDAVFPFERIGDAHRYVEERKNTGKVILVPE